MSLNNYNKLQKEGADKIGIKLPSLKAASISRESNILNLENTLARINDFKADAGWLMQSDSVKIQSDSTGISQDSPLIEAQFNKGNNSLHIKLVTNGQYNVVELISDAIADSDSIDDSQQKISAYSEQKIYMRNDLANLVIMSPTTASGGSRKTAGLKKVAGRSSLNNLWDLAPSLLWIVKRKMHHEPRYSRTLSFCTPRQTSINARLGTLSEPRRTVWKWFKWSTFRHFKKRNAFVCGRW